MLVDPLHLVAGRPQNVGFNGVWRSNATKFVVLVTDAGPGGFDDTHTAADVADARRTMIMIHSEPVAGLEPATFRLQGECSAN